MSLIPRIHMDRLVAQAAPGERVFSLGKDGSKLWVKRSKKNYLNRFQRLMGSLSSNPLHPMDAGRMRLYREVTRIRALSRMGMRVPPIVAVGKDYIVLGDIGESLEAIMRRSTVDEATPYIQAAASMLAELHEKNGWHGNAKLRNFTHSEAGVGILDFEDPISPLPGCYKRIKDVLMLCGSTYRFDTSMTLGRAVIRTYREKRRFCGIYAAAIALFPLYLLLTPFARSMGRDAQEITQTLRVIYSEKV